MSYGIETYTGAGVRLLTPSDRCIRVFHGLTISGSSSTTIPGWDSTRSGFFVLSSPVSETAGDHLMYIRMSGSTLEWKGVEKSTRVIFYYYR